MTQTFLTVFPNPTDLLAVEPEELGGIILELASGVMENGTFSRNYPPPLRRGGIADAVWACSGTSWSA